METDQDQTKLLLDTMKAIQASLQTLTEQKHKRKAHDISDAENDSDYSDSPSAKKTSYG